jgi:hypothetical protein
MEDGTLTGLENGWVYQNGSSRLWDIWQQFISHLPSDRIRFLPLRYSYLFSSHLAMSKPVKARKKLETVARQDMPQGEIIDEVLAYRKVDDFDRLYFTPTQDQYDRLKKLAEERHETASIPVFFDNFDDELTVRMKCRKGGWNQTDRLISGESYAVMAMLKTAVVKGQPTTFFHIKSVDGPLMQDANEEKEEKNEAPIKRKATPAPTEKVKAAKKPAKKQEVKEEDEDVEEVEE